MNSASVPEVTLVAIVGLFKVIVPVEAPMVTEVAAAPIVMVVGVASRARVAPLELIVPAFRFMVEVETAGLPPMFMIVVPAVPAPVPMFSVFVVEVPTAPVAKL